DLSGWQDGGDDDDDAAGDDDSVGEASEAGPPAVEGEPGATKKGCSVGGRSVGPFALGWLVLAGLGRRRRRRLTAA
ncbi:MAG: hypothetical protein JKY37_14370, partial [Nannocystaceae bacterium]|nr:hypothetical protein [Nannocystaceae bacterium]